MLSSTELTQALPFIVSTLWEVHSYMSMLFYTRAVSTPWEGRTLELVRVTSLIVAKSIFVGFSYQSVLVGNMSTFPLETA